MDSSEIKKLLIESSDQNSSTENIPGMLDGEGISYDFSTGFTQRVLDRIFIPAMKISHEIEFSRYLSFAFSRIALTGIAAIVVLLLSIFLMEGSISFNSIIGLGDSYDESIVYLLTGN